MKLILDFLFIAGIVVNSIILIQLFKKDRFSIHNRFLITIFSFTLFLILNTYAEIHQLKILSFFTFLFNETIEWFMGPLMYLYVKSIFTTSEKFFKQNFKHFIIPILYTLLIPIPILIFKITKVFGIEYVVFLDRYLVLELLITQIYLTVYLLISLRLFFHYRKVYKSNFSTLKKQDFLWIRNLILGMTFACLFYFIALCIEFLSDKQLNSYSYLFTMVIISLLLGYLGYHGFNQSKIFTKEDVLEITPSFSDTKKSSYHLNSLTSKEIQDLQQQLISIFKKEKPYLDENLSLKKTADLLHISDKKLSELLNKYFQTSFYDFINTYRVEEVKNRLSSKEFSQYTLIAIANDSGFTSKTSFYRIFKKKTGLSPSDYRKNLLIN